MATQIRRKAGHDNVYCRAVGGKKVSLTQHEMDMILALDAGADANGYCIIGEYVRYMSKVDMQRTVPHYQIARNIHKKTRKQRKKGL